MLLSCPVFGQTLSIANLPQGAAWAVPAPTTITKAGKDYDVTSVLSGVSHTTLKVNALLYWEIAVHQSVSANWHPSLKIYVQRTGVGTGGALLDGGGTPQLVTTSPTLFFKGLLGLSFARDQVPVQYRIDGISVMLPVKTYTTTIQYTVSGL